MTLYELTGDYMNIARMMEDSDIDIEEMKEMLDKIEGDFEEKADNYARVMKNAQATVDAIKSEIDRLKGRMDTINNRVKWLKENLQRSMEATGKTDFKTDLFSFGLKKNPPTVVVDAPITDIPVEYLKYKDPEVDKMKLKEDLKAGVILDGIAHLEQGQSLRIR